MFKLAFTYFMAMIALMNVPLRHILFVFKVLDFRKPEGVCIAIDSCNLSRIDATYRERVVYYGVHYNCLLPCDMTSLPHRLVTPHTLIGAGPGIHSCVLDIFSTHVLSDYFILFEKSKFIHTACDAISHDIERVNKVIGILCNRGYSSLATIIAVKCSLLNRGIVTTDNGIVQIHCIE